MCIANGVASHPSVSAGVSDLAGDQPTPGHVLSVAIFSNLFCLLIDRLIGCRFSSNMPEKLVFNPNSTNDSLSLP